VLLGDVSAVRGMFGGEPKYSGSGNSGLLSKTTGVAEPSGPCNGSCFGVELSADGTAAQQDAEFVLRPEQVAPNVVAQLLVCWHWGPLYVVTANRARVDADGEP
jgi:hypothetical protein